MEATGCESAFLLRHVGVFRFAPFYLQFSRGYPKGALNGLWGSRRGLFCQPTLEGDKTVPIPEDREKVSQRCDQLKEQRELRYAAYMARVRFMFVRYSRYVAYFSDVGESFRPVLPPWAVNVTYGIAGAYVIGDVAYAGYKKHRAGHPQDVVAATCAHATVFQGIASLGLPAVIIHTVVHQAQSLFAKPSFQKMPRVRAFGPSGLGLACIPFLPVVDEPVERVTDALFDHVWPAYKVGDDDQVCEKAGKSN
eukprot:TRINITY_DN56392_c0_g1_i1.p1 TRINITY_DN56392_c0_g1~~TRINITY_DN56392_c0_g1_i1.p1  ORF type:complete len:275 (+),score=11.72 TRINITY_DN56392_c0_g1_i1:75-827(+)